MKEVVLAPIKETSEDYERLERYILQLLREEIYHPLLRDLAAPKTVLRNSLDDLVGALRSSRISFSNGVFSGSFNSVISNELKKLGAQWDRKTSTWKLPTAKLPVEVKHEISASRTRFEEKMAKIDRKLAQFLPDKIAERFKAEKIFDSALYKVEKSMNKNLKNITVPQELTKEQREKIASEYTDSLKKPIKDFAEKEIAELRERVKKAAFAGNRQESLVSEIQRSYGVSQGKAKFLARQETSLMMTKFKETRYTAAGVLEYKWGCVAGSKNHPVRAWHKALEGKTFRWDDPPITTKPGEAVRRNNPGEDFNCRCFAKPVVRF